MAEELDNAERSNQVLAQIAAAGLVATKVMDCLLQTLMNKGTLLPSEVNDIYLAADMLIQQALPTDDFEKLVQSLARADLKDRLGDME